MIIDDQMYEQLMRILRNSHHPESEQAAKRLRLAHIEAITREIEFNNDMPALCSLQAG
jgi:hypothetical protein